MPISENAAPTAIWWLDLLAEEDAVSPQVFPLPNGGVQVEWLAGNESIEVEIGPRGQVGILGMDGAGNLLVEGEYPDPHGVIVGFLGPSGKERRRTQKAIAQSCTWVIDLGAPHSDR